MRAVYSKIEKNIETGEQIIITGESVRHLQVVRAKINEDILVLNGNGLRIYSKIVSILKKEIILEIQKTENLMPLHQINLAIASPKKEAFEDILKISVELGINKIFPLFSKFSQYEYVHNERIDRLLESALIQSNNVYMPSISNQIKLEEYLKEQQEQLVYFSSRPVNSNHKLTRNQSMTILIGPEAGFSKEEEEILFSLQNSKIIHLSTPILRAPTAVSTAVGYLLGHLS